MYGVERCTYVMRCRYLDCLIVSLSGCYDHVSRSRLVRLNSRSGVRYPICGVTRSATLLSGSFLNQPTNQGGTP